MAAEKNYQLEKQNHNGIHEIVITQNGNDALKISLVTLFTVLFTEVFLQRACMIKYRLVIGIFMIWLLVQRVVNICEKLTIMPEYGLYYEQNSIFGLNKYSFFIAQQDIQCVVINEIFTDQSSIMPMLCVLHQNKRGSVTVLFKKTKPRLQDLVDVYNTAYDCFN